MFSPLMSVGKEEKGQWRGKGVSQSDFRLLSLDNNDMHYPFRIGFICPSDFEVLDRQRRRPTICSWFYTLKVSLSQMGWMNPLDMVNSWSRQRGTVHCSVTKYELTSIGNVAWSFENATWTWAMLAIQPSPPPPHTHTITDTCNHLCLL